MKKIIYLAVIIITAYLKLMYEWEAGITILSAELIFPLICILAAYLIRRKIKVNMIVKKDMAEQKEEIPVYVEVCNKSFLPGAIRVVFVSQYLAEKVVQKKVYKVYVPGRTTEKISCNMIAEHCGRLQVAVEKIKVFDCWGFFSFTTKENEKQTITVMPKPYPVNLVVSNRTRWFPIDGESYAQDRSGEDNAEIYEVREYRAGDRMQKVHWKLSAKSEDLYIKEFSYPLGAAVVVLLEGAGNEGTKFFEAVVSISMALIEKECAHYMVWRKKKEEKTARMLIRNEEDFYAFLMELLFFEKGSLESDMEERYRYEYKNAPYATLLKISTALTLQINGDISMDMQEQGMEVFFEKTEIIV